jgi:polysaccharide biosynthesis PFTS motif protein
MIMHIPVITSLVNKRHSYKIRIISRGYKQIRSEGRLDLLLQLKDVLTKTKLDDIGSLKRVICDDDFDIELSVRQYLSTRMLGLSFNKSILYSLGSGRPLSHPLPKKWRVVLTENGISVNNFGCALLWHMHGFLSWGRGFLKGLLSIYSLLKKQPHLGKYAYFDLLSSNNFSTDINRHNIVNWYLQWKNRNTEINSICHSVDGILNFKLDDIDIIQTDVLPKLKKFQLLQYVGFFPYAVIYSFVWMFFRPSCGFLMEEMLKLKIVDLANDDDLARDYLFNSSSAFFRPLWTYLAEAKGSRILLYYYSTNDAVFKTKDGYPLQDSWHLMSWSHHLVWNESQADFIKGLCQNSMVTEEVGPIWFSSSGEKIEARSNSIAVFDVTPFKYDFYILLGLTNEYYVYNTSSKFLSDIYHVLSNQNISMLHKMKRKSKFSDDMYLRKISQLSEKVNYTSIDPGLDALNIIQQTKACISMPFTSTALIAKHEGKPSVYYDPSGMICKDDRAAHGIPVLNNIDELQQWIEEVNKV